ncbi:MAG: hypothetical protein FWD91_07425 [Treponema sp.]|nr:hypothetical protein [Treponema sp.]
MPLLQVRDFPTELYEKLSRVADAENRSVPQQTIVLLKNALVADTDPRKRRESVLREIDNFGMEGANTFPDPAQMTREDRDR